VALACSLCFINPGLHGPVQGSLSTWVTGSDLTLDQSTASAVGAGIDPEEFNGKNSKTSPGESLAHTA